MGGAWEEPLPIIPAQRMRQASQFSRLADQSDRISNSMLPVNVVAILRKFRIDKYSTA
jgi:hypothetical protein